MSSSTPTGHRVLCYNCSRQYARSEGGLECPHCGSDFVEVLEQPPSPPPHPPPPREEREEQDEPAYTPPFSHRYIPRYYNSAAAQPAQPAQPAPFTPPPSWQSVNQLPLPNQLFSHIDGFPNLHVNSRQFVVGNGTNLRFTTFSTPIPATPHAAPQQPTTTPPAYPDQQPPENQPRAQDETPEEPNFLRSALNAVAHMLNPEGAAAYERDVERPQQEREREREPEREREQRGSLQQQQQQGEASHEPSPAQPTRSSSEPATAGLFGRRTHTAPRVTIFTHPLLHPRDANSPQAATPMVHDFEEFLQHVTANANEYFTPPPGPPPGRTPVPGDGPADHAHDDAQQQGQGDTPRPRLSTPPEGVPPEAMAPLQAILNLMGAVGFNTQLVSVPAGDAVFTEEALQNIMQQLAEQSGPSGPLPASEEAINALPKKPIDTSMLDDEGNAECTICMENVEVGTEVTVLPCKHWFHTECITLWLKEHDSCPHCRKSIMTDEQREAARERQRERQRAERNFGRGGAHRQRAREQVRQQLNPQAQHEAHVRMFAPRAAEGGNQNRGESVERRESAGSGGASTEELAQNQEGQSTGQPREGPGQQQQQENPDGTLANGNRAWFFQGSVPIIRNWPALNWPGITRVFGIGGGESTSSTTTPSADTPRASAASDTHQPTPTRYPSAAAHTLRTYTPSNTDASAAASPRFFGVSSARRAQLEQQQQQSRTLQREQDRRQDEADRDRDFGGRGVTQDFADWVRRFGGMDPD